MTAAPTAAAGAGPGPSLADAPQRTATATAKRRTTLPDTRPPGTPPDPWTAFATTPPERGPGRFRRGLAAGGRAFIHEYALVIYGGLVLAVVLTWPTLRYPMHTLPQDIYDPARQAWQVAWIGHILQIEPVRLWQSNAFFPERYNFAFGGSLLGYAPAGLTGDGMGAALLRYNILFVLAHALLFIGGYALVRQLGAGRTGAVAAAVAFAYAPWRLAQAGHLDIVSAGGIPLALAMLARGHGWSLRYGFRPDRRHAGWAAAGWLVAAWQISLGFSLGLPFAYVLAGILLVMSIAVPVYRLRVLLKERRTLSRQVSTLAESADPTLQPSQSAAPVNAPGTTTATTDPPTATTTKATSPAAAKTTPTAATTDPPTATSTDPPTPAASKNTVLAASRKPATTAVSATLPAPAATTHPPTADAPTNPPAAHAAATGPRTAPPSTEPPASTNPAASPHPPTQPLPPTHRP